YVEEPAPLFILALDRNLASLLFHQPFRDGKPQSCALWGVISTSLDLSEFLKYNLLIFGPDADPGVGYRHVYELRDISARDGNQATLGSEFDRVAEQVVEDLLKTHSICSNQRIAVQLLLNPDVLGHCQWGNSGQHFR